MTRVIAAGLMLGALWGASSAVNCSWDSIYDLKTPPACNPYQEIVIFAPLQQC